LCRENVGSSIFPNFFENFCTNIFMKILVNILGKHFKVFFIFLYHLRGTLGNTKAVAVAGPAEVVDRPRVMAREPVTQPGLQRRTVVAGRGRPWWGAESLVGR
jgi:hypothetical protein